MNLIDIIIIQIPKTNIPFFSIGSLVLRYKKMHGTIINIISNAAKRHPTQTMFELFFVNKKINFYEKRSEKSPILYLKDIACKLRNDDL